MFLGNEVEPIFGQWLRAEEPMIEPAQNLVPISTNQLIPANPSIIQVQGRLPVLPPIMIREPAELVRRDDNIHGKGKGKCVMGSQSGKGKEKIHDGEIKAVAGKELHEEKLTFVLGSPTFDIVHHLPKRVGRQLPPSKKNLSPKHGRQSTHQEVHLQSLKECGLLESTKLPFYQNPPSLVHDLSPLTAAKIPMAVHVTHVDVNPPFQSSQTSPPELIASHAYLHRQKAP